MIHFINRGQYVNFAVSSNESLHYVNITMKYSSIFTAAEMTICIHYFFSYLAKNIDSG